MNISTPLQKTALEALNYVTDGFNLNGGEFRPSKATEITIINALNESPTDMGEERGLNELQEKAKQEGWDFSYQNAWLFLFFYVFDNISYITTTQLEEDLLAAGFDKRISHSKPNCPPPLDDDWWEERGQYFFNDVSIIAFEMARLVKLILYNTKTEDTLAFVSNHVNSMKERLNDSELHCAYERRLEVLVENTNPSDTLNWLIHFELSLIKNKLSFFVE